MALSDKDIIITPNRGQAADPKIEFRGADASTAAQTITLKAYPALAGTVAFEGSAGQLFTISNNLSTCIGIGTLTPNDKLTISGASNNGITFSSATNATIYSSHNLLNSAVNHVYLRPGSGYNVVVDTGNGLNLTMEPTSDRSAITRGYSVAKGENLVVNGSGLLGNNYNFSSFTFDPAQTYSGGGSFRKNVAYGGYFNDEYIPVNPGKNYRLTTWARSGEDGGTNYNASNYQYLGIAPYDIDGSMIDPFTYSKYPGSTDTTLTVALTAGATTMTVANATGWADAGSLAYQRGFVWYGYTNSKGYTYPNYTYSRNISYYVSATYQSSGTWAIGGISGNVITLTAPWPGPTIPAGTAVRNNTSGGTYKYITIAGAVPNAWTNFEGFIGGIDTGGTQDANKFPYGTAFVKLLFLTNYHGLADNNIRYSNVNFTEISSRNLEPATPSYSGVVNTTAQSFAGEKTFTTSVYSPIYYASNDTANRFTNGALVLRGSAPTVYFRDTDQNSAMIHVNSNILYVLRGANDTETYTQVNSAWPLEINLTNNDAMFGRHLTALGNLTVSGGNIYGSSTGFVFRNASSGVLGLWDQLGNLTVSGTGTSSVAGNLFGGSTTPTSYGSSARVQAWAASNTTAAFRAVALNEGAQETWFRATTLSPLNFRHIHIDAKGNTGNQVSVRWVKEINGTESTLMTLSDGDLSVSKTVTATASAFTAQFVANNSSASGTNSAVSVFLASSQPGYNTLFGTTGDGTNASYQGGILAGSAIATASQGIFISDAASGILIHGVNGSIKFGTGNSGSLRGAFTNTGASTGTFTLYNGTSAIISDTTASTSTSTGALIVGNGTSGGLGVGGAIWAGDYLCLGMNTLGSGYSLRLKAGGANTLYVNGSDGLANGQIYANVIQAGDYLTASRILIGSTIRLGVPADGILKLSNSADTDFNRLLLGGNTASYPAIKRNAAAISFRLADDSADAAISASSLTLSSYTVSGANGFWQVTGSPYSIYWRANGLLGLGVNDPQAEIHLSGTPNANSPGIMFRSATTAERLYSSAAGKVSVGSGATLEVLSTTASTSTSTGALVVSGGMGVAGAAFIRGNVTVNSQGPGLLFDSLDASTSRIFAASGTTIAIQGNNQSGAMLRVTNQIGNPTGAKTLLQIDSGAAQMTTVGCLLLDIYNRAGDPSIYNIDPAGKITHAPQAVSKSSWTTSGALISYGAATITNSSTVTSGTAASAVFHSWAAPTLAATNTSVTTTDAATLYVAGSPIAGTNQTITNSWALQVNSGNSTFGGDVKIQGNVYNAKLILNNQFGANAFWVSAEPDNSFRIYNPGSNSSLLQGDWYDVSLYGNGSRVRAGNSSLTLSLFNSGTIGIDSTGSYSGSSTNFRVLNTTASTSTSTGALVVSGGAGFAKDVYINSVRVGLGEAANADSILIGAVGTRISGGTRNLVIGSQSTMGASLTGNENVIVGFANAQALSSGSNNTVLGSQAGQITTGNHNTLIGWAAGILTQTGSNSIAIGSYALNTAANQSGNVAIGFSAGKYETGSNAFYVDNQDRTNTAGDKAKALLYGTFNATAANQTLTINAATTVSNTANNISTTSNALVVTGGVGVGGSIYSAGRVWSGYGVGASSSIGTGINDAGNNGIILGFNYSSYGSANNFAYISTPGVATYMYFWGDGRISLNNTTLVGNTTDTTGAGTGALQVSGGMYVAKALIAGGNLTVGSGSSGTQTVAKIQQGATYGPSLQFDATGVSGATSGRIYSIYSSVSNDGVGAGKWGVFDNTANASRLELDSSGNFTVKSGYIYVGSTSNFYLRATGSDNGLIRANVFSVDAASSFVVRNAAGSTEYFKVDTTNGNITLSSATLVSNLNADYLDGLHATSLFNNHGEGHGARTAFDATTPSYDFGYRYVQGSTNGPGSVGGVGQFYSWYIGLGSQYPATGAGSYGAMFAIERNTTTPYLSVRYNESNSFGSWRKISAGTADTLTTARNIAGVSFNGSADITLTGQNISTARGTAANDIEVAKYLRWKNYGNNHILIDASNGTEPGGGAIDKYTAQNTINSTGAGSNTWGEAISLMGWNGANTYGVRVDRARSIDNQANSATITAATTNTSSQIVLRDASGNFSAGRIDASSVYDIDNTAYYADFNSTADDAIRVRGGAVFGPNTSWGRYLMVGGNGRQGYIDNTTYASVACTNGNLHLDAASGFSTYINWYDGNDLLVGAGDSGTTRLRVYGASNYTEASGSLRAPIFYDSDNTSYYVDPTGTSVLNQVNTNYNIYPQNYGLGLVGLYSPYRYQAVFSMGDSYKLPADGTTTGSLYGLAWSHPNAGGVAGNLNTHGLLAMENGTWLASLSGSVRARDDMRAPVFYDSNNTAYYCDPSSTSNLNGLTVAGTITGSISGNAATATTANSINAVIAQSLRAANNISGGGTISVDSSYNVKWDYRLIMIANGRGSNFAVSGYWDIFTPAAGTVITGVGGASNATVVSAGIPMAIWTALYYILPIGTGNGTNNGNFRLVNYTADVDIPSDWVFICLRNGDDGYVHFANGIVLGQGQSSFNGIQTSNNVNNAVVRRDSNGNFAANAVYASSFVDLDESAYFLDPNATIGGQFKYNLTINGSGTGTGRGLALYPEYASNVPTYGITFATTTNLGTHGSVNNDWATYFTMNGTSGRGWIFRNVGTPANVASISNAGYARFASLGIGTDASGTAGEIRATNNITAYYSDERLKTRLGPIENPIEKVKSLSGFYFAPNDTAMALGYKKTIDVGVSAQQVKEVLPEIIAPAPIDPQYMTVRYEKLIPLLIEAIKEQQTQIESLKEQVAQLLANK